MPDTSEGQAIADAKADEIARLPWRDLDAYGERLEDIAAPSGRTFRVKSHVSWGMEPWASGINISVKAYPRMVSDACWATKRGGRGATRTILSRSRRRPSTVKRHSRRKYRTTAAPDGAVVSLDGVSVGAPVGARHAQTRLERHA
jgi:hypothetical protein